MSKLENIEKRVEEVNELANAIAKKANDELSVAKHKITCLSILAGLFAILGSIIAIYSVHSMKQLFYDMTIEEDVVYEQEVDQETNGDGSNYFINDSENIKVGE